MYICTYEYVTNRWKDITQPDLTFNDSVLAVTIEYHQHSEDRCKE